MFGLYMKKNLKFFSSLDQYSFPVSFRKEFEKYCVSHDSV